MNIDKYCQMNFENVIRKSYKSSFFSNKQYKKMKKLISSVLKKYLDYREKLNSSGS